MKKIVLEEIVSILSSYGAKKISLFGSTARREDKPQSDIDLIVEFKSQKSLLDLVKIERRLSKKIGRKVDLLTKKSLSPYIAEKIRGELKVLYA